MNGYTSFEIRGEKVGLKFALPALGMIETKLKSINKIPRIGDMYTTYQVAYMLYAAYFNNCLIKDEEEKFSYEDFINDIEENVSEEGFMEKLRKVISVYQDSINVMNEKIEEKKRSMEEKKIGTTSEKNVLDTA